MGEKPTAQDEAANRVVTNAPETTWPSAEGAAERGPIRIDSTPARTPEESGGPEARHVYQQNQTDLDFLQKKMDDTPPDKSR